MAEYRNSDNQEWVQSNHGGDDNAVYQGWTTKIKLFIKKMQTN